mmetsp:Transcript_27333/g.50383  ORF Transcript_27333/g.50383 Transcript_27333/m.50383 type:complete len:553 (+) Transcript_27333:214-1872(+)
MGNELSGRKGRSSRSKAGGETPVDSGDSSQRGKRNSKKKEKVAAATASKTPAEKPKVTMDTSAVTLGDAKINNRRDMHPHPVMITDTLSDVRVKYHINPKEIGHGHYGVVRKCMHRETKVWYAIKSIRKSKVGKVDVLKREVALLKECDHPNIIQLIEVHEDQKYLHLITELCTGGELFDRIIEKTQSDEGHFSELDAANLVRSIMNAIAYCHDQKGIVHRDLKPENFLFSSRDEDAVIKIIDFGLSRHDDMKAGIMNTKVGTPYYVAPEVLNREYTKNCDIWSIGVITYILLCGYPPFYGDTDNQIFDSVRTGRFDFPSPDWDGISDNAKDFICSLLKRDPSKRLSASEALVHPWIKEMTVVENPKKGHRKQRTSIAFASRSIAFIKYRDMQKLKKSALAWLATNATNDDITALKDVFKKIDVNNDGTITLQELDACLKDAHFLPNITSDLLNLQEELSVSGEDSLNWRDFIALMMDKDLVMKEGNLRMAFEHFKSSNRNHIVISDIVDLVGGSEKQAMDIMKLVDDNSDGRIDFNEFRKMMEDENLLYLA